MLAASFFSLFDQHYSQSLVEVVKMYTFTQLGKDPFNWFCIFFVLLPQRNIYVSVFCERLMQSI